MSLNKTAIEWVKNPDGTQGYTWNPLTGCLNHIDGMCKGGNFPCYAYRLATTKLKERYLANRNIATHELHPILYTLTLPHKLDRGYPIEADTDPFYPRFWPERLNELGNFNSPGKGIFVCDMGELFGDWVRLKWQDGVFDCLRTYDNHRFYLLTKQPQNLIKFSPFPDNCWVGVTATEPFPHNTPLAYLAEVEAKIKYISFEPLLKWSAIHLSRLAESFKRAGINWVIIGALTSKKHSDLVPLHTSLGLDIEKHGNIWILQPKIEWIKEIVEAADKAGVAVFLKNNLEPLLTSHTIYDLRGLIKTTKGEDARYTWKIRQEMPLV